MKLQSGWRRCPDAGGRSLLRPPPVRHPPDPAASPGRRRLLRPLPALCRDRPPAGRCRRRSPRHRLRPAGPADLIGSLGRCIQQEQTWIHPCLPSLELLPLQAQWLTGTGVDGGLRNNPRRPPFSAMIALAVRHMSLRATGAVKGEHSGPDFVSGSGVL